MARKTDAEIQSMNTDWGRDPITGLPFSGQSVQTFIKRTFNQKVGAGLFDATDMALYLFKDEADKEEFDNDRTKVGLIIGTIPMRFETTQYRIRVTPSGNTNVNVSINANKIELEMELQAERRELGEPIWQPTNQDIGVRVYVDARNTGNYEEIPELAQTVLATSGNLKVDVKPYLPIGLNRVRFYFYAVDDTTLSSSLVYNITLAEMYIEEWGNTWDKPLIENIDNGNYHLGGFKIVGTVNKMLHIEITTAFTQVAYYEQDIAGREAIETSYLFTRGDGLDLQHPRSEFGESLPALTTGIYNVKVWLTSGELSTEDTAITYNIMYIAPGDEYSARLVVMNNSGNEVNNYDETAHLCDYSIYNAGETYGTPTIVITPYIAGTPEASTTITSSIFTSTKQSLIHNISVVTSRDNLTIRYRITMTDNYQEDVSPVNNKEIFPSESGDTFYLNPGTRANGETGTREIVYNSAGGTSVPLADVTWTGMSWVDGMDGWDTDDTGRKCLSIPARSRLVIPTSSYQFFSGNRMTIELCYKVANVSDYSENVITIAQNPTQAGFMGLRIRPTNITVHSTADRTAENDTYRGTNLCDEEVVHLVLTIQNSFSEHNGFNLVTGYVNGVKNFQFDFDSTAAQWSNNNAPAIFGSDTADLYLYSVRAYSGKAISSVAAEGNWLNSLVTLEEKTAYRHFIDSILPSGNSREISYEKIKDEGKYNFFVVEMTSGSVNVPTMSYPSGGRSNIEMHFGQDENGVSMHDKDWKIYDVETKGQGTTSMNYWLWNIRWRIDKTDSSKKRDVAYYDDPVISSGVREFVELPKHSSKTVWFDGEGNHPAVKRITAKINFASSMQAHKMGATKAYNALHDSILNGALLNEAQEYADTNNLPAPTVAVYQYPAYGFQKTVNNGKATYTFIGLFTIGPDKGDKPTFGYDLVDEDKLVTLEGVDHSPYMTRFSVPWDEQAAYFVNSDGDGFLATKGPNGNYQNAVEVGNAGEADTADASEAMPVLVSKFKPAYDVVYDNSTLIMPIALNDATWGAANAAGVLAKINNNVTAFQKTQHHLDPRLAYSDVEFWIEGEYNLYHYEYESGQYVSGYKANGAYTPLNLLTDTGISASELDGIALWAQNDMFQNARGQRFVQQAPDYWDMNELVFNYLYLLIFGATDNFAKNQYPYNMGGKWRFRQDDLDTIMDIDNNGGQTKPYYLEFEDAENGSYYFAGSNSVLWNLVHQFLWENYTVNGTTYDGILSMGKKFIEQMTTLARGNDDYDGFVKFFKKYFWDNAQEYFPQSAYNIDGSLKYEAAWLTGRSFSVDPMRQSLGSHYSAEKLWVRNRAIYCMSLFGVGPFGDYAINKLGRIQFRPNDLGSMYLTPAMAMYPCIIIGDNDIRKGERTGPGYECEFNSLSGGGQTTYTIQAADYLTDLGDLKDLQINNIDGGTFSASGKRLRTLKFGDAAEEVTTNLVNLSINGTLPCLEVVDLRNAEHASNSLDLSNCKRIKEVYTEGTGISAVILPRGSKIEKLHLSDNVSVISYQVVKNLSDLVLPSDASGITLLYLEECDALDGMDTLEEIYNTTGQQLAYIRLLWGSEQNITGPQVRMLAHIMNNTDKDGTSHTYNGIDISGDATSGAPVIEGKLIASQYYQSDIDILSGGATPEDSEEHPGMKMITAQYFGPLRISYLPENEYIAFVDEDVIPALYAAGIGNSIGITISQASQVSSIGSAFTGKTNISSLDELRYFTGITAIPYGSSSSGGAFRGCTALTSVTIPQNVTNVGGYSFAGCTSLRTVTFMKNKSGSVTFGTNAFLNAPVTRINVQSLHEWMRMNCEDSFSTNHHIYVGDDEVTSINADFLSYYSSIGQYRFYRCAYITSVSIPSSITTIGQYAFYASGISGDISVTNVTSVGTYAFRGTSITSFTNTTACTYGDWCFPTSIRNISIKVTASGITGNVFKGAGNSSNPGTLSIDGDWKYSAQMSDWSTYFSKIYISGSVDDGFGGYFYSVQELRIGGNVLSGVGSEFGIIYNSHSSLRFVEFMDNVFTTKPLFNSGYRSDMILHLGSTTPVTASPAYWGLEYVYRIYVGDGSSQAADQAVWDAYNALPAWSSYMSKMYLWSDYDGPYKETN